MSGDHLRGLIVYRYDDSGESGREWVSLTANANGSRTVRALCDLDDVALRRDVVATYGPDWRARDAYVHMIQDGKFLGAGRFTFEGQTIDCEATTSVEGQVSQRLDLEEPMGPFTPHPVFLDGWHAPFHDPAGPQQQEIRNCITSSPRWDGASGPMTCVQHRKIERLTDAEVTVPAGRFACESYRLIPHNPDYPPIDFWVHGPHKFFVKLRWEHLKATYELATYEEIA